MRLIRAALLALLGLAHPAMAATEAELRVAMIFNITRFVQWPSAALNTASFNVCAVGSDAVSDGLSLLISKSVHDLPIAVRAVKRDGDLISCHIVYVTTDQALRLAAISEQINISHTSALTIGAAPAFIVGGGMVQLLTLEGRQRFRINQRAAEAAGLSINAKLLQLALPQGDW